MDCEMPVMDGLEATRRIRASQAGDAPVIIAVSASALDEDRNHVVHCGVDDFVSKPCREDELLEKIRARLDIGYLYAGDERSQIRRQGLNLQRIPGHAAPHGRHANEELLTRRSGERNLLPGDLAGRVQHVGPGCQTGRPGRVP